MKELPLKEEKSGSVIQLLPQHLGEYAETYVRLAGLKATQKAATIASVTLTVALLSASSMFILLFLGLGLSTWIGESLQNAKWGYFIVSGFYFLCTILFFFIRKKVILPMVRTYMIRKIYE
jgi:uncharacterized membrane protein YbhN (UPF0104 family)